MDAAPIPGPKAPRPMVTWTVWIGGLNLALNASSPLIWAGRHRARLSNTGC